MVWYHQRHPPSCVERHCQHPQTNTTMGSTNPTTRPRALLLWAFLTLQNVCHAITDGGLHGYVTINPEVNDLANIALDLQAMQTALEQFEHDDPDEGIQRAHKIYELGGHSRSTCTVTLEAEGLPLDLATGTIVTGVGQGGQTTQAKLDGRHVQGAKTLKLLYTTDNPCFVGGLPTDSQQRDGCLVDAGTLSMSNQHGVMEQVDYVYDAENGNTNERTIHSMSVNANRKFRFEGKATEPFFPSFRKFVTYYGHPDFGDRMIQAAMEGTNYTFHAGTFDFVNSSREARGKLIELFASYLNIGLFIISELENAVEKCADHCQHGDCHHAAIHGLDGAVAFYVGSLQATDKAQNGNLLYGLANEMCQRFKTCGPKGNQLTGVAKVNYDIFELFKEMRDNLTNDKCTDAHRNRDALERLIYVPLIQGFRFANYRRQTGYAADGLVDDAPPFSAAVLPVLGYCDMQTARKIQLNFSPGNRQQGVDPATIETTLQEHYECMGVCCSDVGGLWDAKKNQYSPLADVCVDTDARCLPDDGPVVEEEPDRSWMFYIFLAGLGVAGYLYYKRRKEIKRRRRAAATGEYGGYNDDDDSSVSSVDEMEHNFT